VGAVRRSVASLAPTAGDHMILRERYWAVRRDGRDGAILIIDREPEQTPPRVYPETGEPLRRLCDSAPTEPTTDRHVLAS